MSDTLQPNRGDYPGTPPGIGYRRVIKRYAVAGTFIWYTPSDIQPWTPVYFRVAGSPGGSGDGNTSSVTLSSTQQGSNSSGSISATGGTSAGSGGAGSGGDLNLKGSSTGGSGGVGGITPYSFAQGLTGVCSGGGGGGGGAEAVRTGFSPGQAVIIVVGAAATGHPGVVGYIDIDYMTQDLNP